MIGERLKLARSAAGLSLRKLQERIQSKVSAQAISKYERNQDMPSSEVLMALADALSVSEEYLLGRPEIVLENVEFRTKSQTSAKEKARLKAEALQKLERYLNIEELLDLPSIRWDKPHQAPYCISQNLVEIEQAAYNLRNHWALGLDPIPNLVELLEERGIKVISFDLSSNTSGFTGEAHSSDKEDIPFIIINKDDWSERKRFNLAHELGHRILDVAPKLDEEKAAQRFAGAFLVPAETLRAKVGKKRTDIPITEFVYLKELFGVSIQALTYRCKDLGIISDSLYRNLFKFFSRKGWRKPPYAEYSPLDPKNEEPKRFERLCYRALAEGGITKEKAAELLDTSVNDLINYMEELEYNNDNTSRGA